MDHHSRGGNQESCQCLCAFFVPLPSPRTTRKRKQEMGGNLEVKYMQENLLRYG
jgi:hypothetical protein